MSNLDVSFPFKPVRNPHYDDWQYVDAESLYLLLFIENGVWDAALTGAGKN